jgi:ATP-dependent RNA helicase RhlE
MLDLGFLPPIRKIVARLPQRRQNLFFSATMPPEIRRLAAELLKDPAEVAVAPPATTIDRVRQEILFVEADRKKALLSELFADSALCKTIVFTRTKRGADRVARHLEACGVEAAAIHGDKSQPQREKALLAFRNGALRALVATDIAARGIDISEVSHVINFELPNVPESYVHRIGRTARAGAAGIAVSLVSDDERQLLKDIQKTTRQTVPATDRRRDPHLAQMAAVDRAAAGPEAPRGARPQAAGPRRHGAGGRSEAPARGVRSAQPSGQGPRRRRGAGAGRAGG